MSRKSDILGALNGAWLLARFDTRGYAFFDVSVVGFWRSFCAALLVAPLFLLLIAARTDLSAIEIPLGRYLAVEFSAYALSWLVFPVVMEWLTRTMGCRDKFMVFVIAYNWATIPQYVLFIGIITLGLVGLMPQALSETLSLFVLVWTFIYVGYIAKTALDIPLLTAVGVVFLDFLMGLTLDMLVTG